MRTEDVIMFVPCCSLRKKIQYQHDSGCEIEDFVETNIFKLWRILRSRVIRGAYILMKDIGR